MAATETRTPLKTEDTNQPTPTGVGRPAVELFSVGGSPGAFALDR
jgi:hypothetical protein